jgi:hypothetical protein
MTVTTTSSDSLSGVESAQLGGGKKKNGHKMSCGCPICVNMKHAKHGGSSCKVKTGGKKRKGNGHKPNCGCPICKNMKKTRGGDDSGSFVDLEKGKDANIDADFKDLEMGIGDEAEAEASNSDYADLDAAEKGEAGLNIKVGGTRRRKGRGSRKTTKRAKKTRRKSRKGKRTNRRH